MPASTSGGQHGGATITVDLELDSGQYRFEQACDDLIGVDAVGLGLKVQQDAMPQHRQRDRADVVGRRDAAAVEQRARLRAEHQRLAGARPGAPLHPLPHRRGHRVVRRRRPGRLARTIRSA